MPIPSDNIMKDEAGNPVHVPGNDKPTAVFDGAGNPVVPFGTQKTGSAFPKDTLPHGIPPTPKMPENTNPEITRETTHTNAVEDTITFDELAAKKGFKSPDDLAKSYVNLEKFASKKTQAQEDDINLSDAINARMNPAAAPAVVQNTDDVDTPDEALQIVDSRVSRQVQKAVDPLLYKLHLLSFPEDRPLQSGAIKAVRNNPHLSWEEAFAIARSSNVNNLVTDAQERGRREAYSLKTYKENIPGQGGSAPRQGSDDVSMREVAEGLRSGKIPLSQGRSFINKIAGQLQ